MERKEVRTTELKKGKMWEIDETLTTYNTTEIYRSLANALINKKINGCLYIKSIRRTNLYDGFQKIIITYSENVRAIYIVKNN